MTKLLPIFLLIQIPFANLSGQIAGNETTRFSRDSIQGVYIPKELADCLDRIDVMLNDSTKSEIRNLSEYEFGANAHFGLGLWIRNHWQLWGGSRLSRYFNNMGISQPDDMSGIILDSYHRHLNNQDIKLNEQVQYYKDYWRKEEERIKEENREFLTYKVGDTVTYNCLLGFSSQRQANKYLKHKCLPKGIVIDKSEDMLTIKVRVINCCGIKGIIGYPSTGTVEYYDPLNKRRPKSGFMKVGTEGWFSYTDWQLKK